MSRVNADDLAYCTCSPSGVCIVSGSPCEKSCKYAQRTGDPQAKWF